MATNRRHRGVSFWLVVFECSTFSRLFNYHVLVMGELNQLMLNWSWGSRRGLREKDGDGEENGKIDLHPKLNKAWVGNMMKLIYGV